MRINRPVVEALENILGHATQVLDHGFVRLIDYMGNDAAVVQAARVSYGEGTKTMSSDTGLINYLMRHRHTTPFEMCEIKLHLKMPLFVARQWLRHRTANVNEISARYSIIKHEFFIPAPEAVCQQSTNNKQGSGDSLDTRSADEVRSMITSSCEGAFAIYDALLTEHDVARELSRAVLPQGTYTEFYWKIDLHNILHFLSLRNAPKAQKEIQAFAQAVADIIRQWMPITYHAFENYRVGSINFSGQEVKKLVHILDSDRLENFVTSGQGTKGEEREFVEKLAQLLEISKLA